MGTKYTSQSTSGYGTGAPPDDGTTGDNNKIKWSVILSSLTDVLKVFTEGVNTQLIAWFDVDTNARSSNYTTLVSDNGKTIECTASPDITLGTAGTMTTGYVVTVKCVSGTTTVKTGEQIDGSASDRSVTAGNSETYRVNGAATEYLIDGNKGVTDTETVTLTNKTLTSPTLTDAVLDDSVGGTAVDVDSTMAADSDTLLASQKAIAAHVATELSAFAGSTDIADTTNQSATFANGIIVKWGFETISGASTKTVTFGTAFPTACFGASITDYDSSDSGGADNLSLLRSIPSTTTLSVSTHSTKDRIYWTAIGY